MTGRFKHGWGLVFALILIAPGTLSALPPPAYANVRDYGYLWWPNGVRTDSRVWNIQTSRYALSFDAASLGINALFPVTNPPPESRLLTQSDSVGAFPESAVGLSCLLVNGATTNTVGASSTAIADMQIVECGKFFQRRWQKLRIPGGPAIDAQQSGLEIAAWPDRLSMVLRIVPAASVADGSLQLKLNFGGRYHTVPSNGAFYALVATNGTGFVFGKSTGSTTIATDSATGLVTVTTAAGAWDAGQERSVGLVLYPAGQNVAGALSAAVAGETTPLTISARQLDPTPVNGLVCNYDADRGWYNVGLRSDIAASDPNLYERTRVCITNNTASPREVHLNFAKEYGWPQEPGTAILICDPDGGPSGLPVQHSKDWHTGTADRWRGPWFHGLTMLTVPAGTTLAFDVVLVGGNYGGVPAATHSQLCLIGWGSNQQWNEAAIGAWGESLTYEPDGAQAQAACLDSRPLLVRDRNGETQEWTGNVGGADFLRYFDAAGTRRWPVRMRTRYMRYSPNLAEACYAGETDDGQMEFNYTTALYRSDDITRGLHRFRMDVKTNLDFSRLLFFEVAADTYNYGNGDQFAYGYADQRMAVRQWHATFGQNKNIDSAVALTGAMPWVSLHDVSDYLGDKFRGANRGFIIRSWEARINGTNAPPYLQEYSVAGTESGANLEIVPPPEVGHLSAGDYVEAEFERIYPPKYASDYYGPDDNFKTALTNYGNTPGMVLREAVGNDLAVAVQAGVLEHTYPVRIASVTNSAKFTVTRGLGYVPVTFTGLTDYRDPVLEEKINGAWVPLNQSVFGNDFWQCDYNAEAGTWEITFNVKLDGTNYQDIKSLMLVPQMRTFRFHLGGGVTPPASVSPDVVHIRNPGFETPYLAEGVETSPYTVPGWEEYEPSHPWEWECYAPASSYCLPHGGRNVLMAYAYDPATQYLDQQLTNTLQLNTCYRLSAWVADPDDHTPENSALLMLYAGPTLLGTVTIQPKAARTWASNTLVYVTGASHAQAGQPLKVRIMVGAENIYRVLVDDVSLNAVPAASVPH